VNLKEIEMRNGFRLLTILFAAMVLCCCQGCADASKSDPAPTGSEPAFDSHADVGKIDHPGAHQYNAERHEYRITGSGANIWAKEDAFHFVYRKTSGDVELSADITFVGEGKNAHRKGCCMIRQSLDADAAYVDVAVHGDGSIGMQYRKTKGDITDQVKCPIKAPATVRLERKGDAFTLWYAAKGEQFQSVGPVSVSMKDPVFTGLVVSAHDAAVSETAIFSNVALKIKSNER
jgi:hypothetical protein